MTKPRPKSARATPASGQTVEQTVARVARTLARARVAFGHGTTDAAQEATWLVAHVLKLPFGALAAHRGEAVTAPQVRSIDRLLIQRTRDRIPLAYLLREAWLGDLRFYVDRRVIVPRSFIAELLRDRLRPWIEPPSRIRRVLDLCTGSGCLAIAAAHAFPRAQIDASDLSKPALVVAKRNVECHGLTSRIRLVHSDGFAALAGERYDLIVSNPPYVAARSMRALPTEYRQEPVLALAGGTDGLALVRTILEQMHAHLRPAGSILIEIGHNRRALERAYPRLPFVWPMTSGGDRFVCLLEREDLERMS